MWCLYAYMYVCMHTWRPGRDIRSLGAGVRGGCEPLEVGAGICTPVRERAVNALYYWTISPVLTPLRLFLAQTSFTKLAYALFYELAQVFKKLF